MTDRATEGLRHYAHKTALGDVEIVDRETGFARSVLNYDYRFTCNADIHDHAERICQALEGPMASQGVARAMIAAEE